MTALLLILIAAVSYALGTLSSPILLAKYVFHKDISRPGRFVGYNTFVRHFGRKWGFAVILGDIVKAAVAVIIGGLLMKIPGGEGGFPVIGKLFAGFCVVLGDIYPIQRNFRGGKGVTCLFTALWLADWRIGLFVTGVFVAVLALSQFLSLASLSGGFTGMIAAWIFVESEQMKGLAGVLVMITFLFILWRHRGNIGKLLAKKEPKVNWGRQPDSRLREDRF
ncbi:MAG: glycerol-3-phosphate acyltransferase [Oscillospiraceae bacterium]